MDSSQVLRRQAAVLWWCVAALCCGAAADANTEKSIQDALADADRYAGGFSDGNAYVANAWERAVDGWVRGGYTLVSGDVHTDVRYVVDPSGEMRVMARRPGAQAPAAAGTQAAAAAGVLEAPARHRLGSPLLGGYRPPFYQRLIHHVGGGLGLDDDDAFDDVDLDSDVDDGHVDEDEPFFFDMSPDNWSASPVDDWARLAQAEQVGGVRRGPDPATARTFVGCKSTRCHAGRSRAGMGGRPRPQQAGHANTATTSGASAASSAASSEGLHAPPATRLPEDAVGAASFQSGHYDLRVRTLKQ